MVDTNKKLQSLFADLDPDVIGEKLVSGMKDITDAVVMKKRIQTRKHINQFWTKELEEGREKLKNLNTIAIRTRDPEDLRMYKNFKKSI